MILPDELEDLSCLRHSSPAYRAQVASMARLKEFPAGACIIHEGDRSGDVYLVLGGDVALEVKVPECGTVEVHRLCRGDLLGYSPALGHKWLTATARAVTACRLAALNATAVQTLTEKDASFASEFFRSTAEALAERLQAFRHHLPAANHHEHPFAREGAD
jgi:CRP-like cAMP-binding protein